MRGAVAARGFSFIELMVTLAILGLLGSMVAPVAQLSLQRHRETQLRDALREIRNALDAYHAAVQQGAIQVPIGASGYPPNLEALVQGAVDLRSSAGQRIYFLRRIPRNPFFDDPRASDADTWQKRAYASSAEEPREGADVYDVHAGAGGIGLNGTPYRLW